MRKFYDIKKIVLLMTVSILSLVSCKNEDLVILNTPNGFIQIDGSVPNLAEDDEDGVNVTVKFGGETNENGITVNYTLTSEDNTRFIDENNGSVEIAAGEYSTTISIKPVDNIFVDGDLVVTLTLDSSSSVPVGLAGEGVNNVSQVINIIDNDCPIVYENIVGTYNGTDNWYSSVGGPLDTQMIASSDGSIVTVVGIGHAWIENPEYWAEEIIQEGEIELQIDPITGDVTIPYTYTATALYLGSPYDYYVQGSGKYFSCSDTFELNFEIFYAGQDPVSGYFGVPGFIWRETLTR